MTFPTITTSQFRVVFTPQAGKFVGVTELGSWYPETPQVKIVNKNSNLELGITGSSIVAGAAVQQQSASDSANHWWKIVPAENGYYKIFNTNSGQVIGVKGASTTAGAAAVQWGDTLTADHLWSIVDAGGGYAKLVNKNSGLVLGYSIYALFARRSAADGAQSRPYRRCGSYWRAFPRPMPLRYGFAGWGR
ncbi:RICIN domain-containing protein [Streptomyces stelliscabiei]|uniref:Ricin B lectin domain-containing protein n=2 Tax=Streptomyces stelliscabiei TaxID=146820 RepID=A0A8I0PHY3_9ACTN|nr:RICIN domain-containing protein [Streptomyces stelliscabiei]MBE1602866.1 hypothetical protein [Streptomyces stelliscabiei]MDX2521887.1 RICIN domain-containing protein [Streptomyces stelliscabiei]